MSLYDEIKSPLDDVKTLKGIIDIYAKHRVDRGSRPVESGDDFYNGVTKFGKENEHSQNEYITEFEKYIKLPNLDRLYENIKNPDFVRNLDDFVTKKINEVESMKISDIEKESQIEELKKRTLYPLSRFKSIFGKFGTYHEFYDFFREKNLWQAKHIYENIQRFPSLKDEYLRELNGLGLSEKQIELVKKMSNFMNLMDNRFYGGGESMGFHVHPQNLQITNTGIKRENADMKFYLNAGIDTYKVAQLFQQKCEQAKLNYYFKVVNADRSSEYERSDKMCIYTEFKDAEKFLDLLKKIKVENPDINFQPPPILTGRIDKFIGVGMDHIDNNEGSYNGKMSKVCYDAVSSMFQNIPRVQIPAFVDSHPEMLYKLKETIKQQAKKMGLDQEKLCVKPEIKQKLEIYDKQTTNNKENSTVTAQNESHKDSGNIKQETKGQDVKDFVLKFVESYKRLETNAQYDKRLDREESDMEYVADYVNKFRKGKIDEEYFLGIQPEELDKYGRVDFSQNNIDRMFRMLNSANNLTVGNNQYVRAFCESPEIKSLLTQMQKSPAVQNMINHAETEKKMGNQGRGSLRGETPAERDVHLAREGFKSLKEKAKMSGRDDSYVFDTIIGDFYINFGYESEEELALAKVCCRQRGIKTQFRDLGGKYKLDIVDQTQNQDLIDPKKVKQDTIVAGVNLSEITRNIKEIKDHFLNVVKGEKADMNR